MIKTILRVFSFITKRNKMKNFKVLVLVSFIILIIGCSKEDGNTIENGTNKTPNQKNAGQSARDFLSDNKYQSLVIEVSYVENLSPQSQSLLNLKTFLENRLNKPNGITIFQKQIPSQIGSPFSTTAIRKIEDDVRSKYNDDGILTLHLLFINGGYIDDTADAKVLGVAYRNTSCVLFENTIQQLSNQIGEPTRVDLETTVLTHEVCHLLGLVDLGSSMQTNHIDPEHGKHCNNQNCLMYWEIENTNVVGMMAGGTIPQLDANCINDLQANGGK